ncbi:carbamoyltransferase HypF, partial [candidate division KSB1 bacterium]
MVQLAVNGKTTCFRIHINGIVQGVGFRPFIYRLAVKYGINGYIKNNSSGVDIEAEGAEKIIKEFVNNITDSAPPLTKIESLEINRIAPGFYTKFNIIESSRDIQAATLIPPDISICDECLKELFDPSDRRYLYPFINCTNCGPRYTIIEGVPYDREATTMKEFKMCEECTAEYSDPMSRRFHAQPNACSNCGPQVKLTDNRSSEIICDDPIKESVELLLMGRIIAVKGLGGFHLACDAENDKSVALLRVRKKRADKPFAVMVKDMETLRTFAEVSIAEEKLLISNRRPIVLLKKNLPNTISKYVSPGVNRIGAFLPYTPMHYMLMQGIYRALVMTSGNISEEPIIKDNFGAYETLRCIADYFLVHDRDIYQRNDDSVLSVNNGRPYPLRRSRGFVPEPVILRKSIPSILACGADLKNTFCITRDDKAFLSRYNGDLSNNGSYSAFINNVEDMKVLLEIQP